MPELIPEPVNDYNLKAAYVRPGSIVLTSGISSMELHRPSPPPKWIDHFSIDTPDKRFDNFEQENSMPQVLQTFVPSWYTNMPSEYWHDISNSRIPATSILQ